MRTAFASFAAILLASGAANAQQPAQGKYMVAPLVFFDVAGPADAKLAGFYKEVFGWESGPMGNLSVPVNGPPLSGTFRTDPAEKVIYIGVPNVSASLAKVVTSGGKIDVPRFEVPGVVILGLFFDPAGNRMGLVEMGADDRAKVP